MMKKENAFPKILAMCGKQGIDGDDSLYGLFRTRLTEAGIGVEMYPESFEEARELVKFLPENHECSLHLLRNLNVLVPEDVSEIISYVDTAPGKIFGLIVHDQKDFSRCPEKTFKALLELDHRLRSFEQSPFVFVEYAAMLDPDFFLTLFEVTPGRQRVFPCLDICHLALTFCRQQFASRHPTRNVFEFTPDSPELPSFIADIQLSCLEAFELTMEILDRLARLEGPLHFHLHDGHPCSTLSRWHVSDHLSFLQKIRIPFPFKGSHLLPGIFGVNGLKMLLKRALERKNPKELSFMIEVHPQPGRTPLGPYFPIFSHWNDLTNAEQVNFWIDSLLANVDLVRNSILA
ncbi:MAG: hypothetical protein KKB51_11980 [Candidatus Riflebacteria bacterium]|nr:hypothetical protein [Candidatus Riflebacteria bacterium]